MSEMTRTRRSALQEAKTASRRIQWIDLAKGLAMILIIAGHAGHAETDRYLYTFHVPVFFLISGYFITEKGTFRSFTWKKIRSLVFPYCFTVLLMALLAAILQLTSGQTAQALPAAGEWLLRGLYGSGSKWVPTLGKIQHIGPPWYLWALFWASLLVRLTIKKTWGFLLVLLIAAIGYLTSPYVWLPLSLQAGATGAIYVYLGAEFRKNGKELKASTILFLAGAAFLMWETANNWRLSIASNRFDYTFLTGFGAVMISAAFLCLCQWLDSVSAGPISWLNRFFRFLGTHSLMLLCVHTLEFTFLPWAEVEAALSMLPPDPMNWVVLILKVVLDGTVAFLLSKIKPIRIIFGQSK